MIEAIIGAVIVIIILLVWHFQFREETPVVPVPKPAQQSASETAARTIATAEAPKGVSSTTSISAGSSAQSSEVSTVLTAILPTAILPTTSADVAKSPSVITPPAEVKTGTAPIVPTKPVTSALPAGGATATSSQLSSMLPTYTFHQGMTFGGSDLANTGLTDNVTKLAAWCDANTKCKGFTTNAWMKSTIVPQEKWYKWSDDATKGLYVKK